MTERSPAGYDEVAVERVRRTLDAVAGSVDHEREPVLLGPFDRPRLAAGPSGRARWWLGAGAVGVAAAGLVAFVAVAGRTEPAGNQVAGGRLEAGTADQAPPMVGGVPNTDIVLPGVVPDGFSFNSFRVLDPLDGSIEVEVYADGNDTIVGFVTDVPDTADRLAERTDLWGDVIVIVDPTHARSDGYFGFGRQQPGPPRVEEVDAVLNRLATGAAAADAAPEGYDLAASHVTVDLPEAGRMVAVDYLRGSSSIQLATRQGTLDAELARHLYAKAEAVEIRGRDGFMADDGRLLVWQEAPGIVVTTTAVGVDPELVTGFVAQLEMVSEDDWVALRQSASLLEHDEVDTPNRPDPRGRGRRLRVPDGGARARLVGGRRATVPGADRRRWRHRVDGDRLWRSGDAVRGADRRGHRGVDRPGRRAGARGRRRRRRGRRPGHASGAVGPANPNFGSLSAPRAR